MRVPAVRLPGQPGDPESPSPPAPPRWGAGVCANTDTLTPSPTPQDHNVGGCLTAPVRARRDPLTLPTPLGSPVTDTVARCREPSSRPLAAGRGRGTPPAWWGLPRLPHTSRGQRRACPAWEAQAPHRTAPPRYTGRCWTTGPTGGARQRGHRPRAYPRRTGSGGPFPAERSHGESAARLLPAAIRPHPPPAAGLPPSPPPPGPWGAACRRGRGGGSPGGLESPAGGAGEPCWGGRAWRRPVTRPVP